MCIYGWMDVFLVLSPRAKELLSPVLNLLGEFLPFECRDEEYYVFSVHSVIEPAPSESNILSNNGVFAGVSSLSFRPEAVGTQILFKTSFDRFSHLYCTEKFKDIIELNGLNGILFSSDFGH